MSSQVTFPRRLYRPYPRILKSRHKKLPSGYSVSHTRGFLLILSILLLTACSNTKNLPQGEKLYVGIKKIHYQDTIQQSQNTDHLNQTKLEIEAALAAPPNGSLFGSAYIRNPFSLRLAIWNTFSTKNTKFANWITKNFGKAPILISNVNPQLRSSIATNVLKNNGYFSGYVIPEILDTNNPKEQKVTYHVHTGQPSLIDTLQYTNFPPSIDTIIQANTKQAQISHGTPFSATTLDNERTRITTLLRNSGYYYYKNNYSKFLADTTTQNIPFPTVHSLNAPTFGLSAPNPPKYVTIRLQMADSIPQYALKPWHIGTISIDIKRAGNEQITDSTQRRHLKYRFSGAKSPVRPRVILAAMRIPPKSLYNYQKHNDALTNLNNLALFRSVDLQYKPRKIPSPSLLSASSLITDTLDLHLTAVLDKPYSFYLETQVKHKLSGRTGPELRIGITKKNAFRGAESFDINLHASYEYQFNNTVKAPDRNSFEVGADASVKWPRLLVPFLKYKTYQTPPSTDLTLSFNLAHRPTYYRLLTLLAAFQYQWTPAKKLPAKGTQQTPYTLARPNNITHTFSPFTLTYQKQSSTTPLFDSILNNNPYLKVAMQDMFIPKMQYNLTYKSPDNYKNPIHLSLTITEAGNFVSLINKLFFKQDWTQPNKTMFNNIYAQFLKFQADISKTWQISKQDKLVAHANLGIIYTYGNLKQAPYVEQFYIGGANTVRAFTARGVGPGAYRPTNQNTSYIDQTGDLLLVLNLEYRRRLINNLYAALFIDAGNIWTLKTDTNRPGANITLSRLLNNIALGTGIGLRYDLDFIVLRLDWGIGLHAPYNTTRTGFYNFEKFKDSHTIHFAVGYPF